MKLVSYKNRHSIFVEFQDKYKALVHTKWAAFLAGEVKNPYFPQVLGHGMVGNKYSIRDENHIIIKEYNTWHNIMIRCYNDKVKKEIRPTYKDVTCCDEWLLFENFYEWIHSQENFDRWLNGDKWAVDKDILVKGNKVYSPETCCLVPLNVNSLFVKSNANRGNFPIGVYTTKGKYYAHIIYGSKNNRCKATAYAYPTPEDAFYLGYKPAKEAYIKKVAQEEYELGNITKGCYKAMMNYQVEITD